MATRLRITRRRALIAGAAVLLVLLVLWSLRPSPLEVEAGSAEGGPLAVAVEEDGRTRTVDRYVVTAPVAGRLERIVLREGEKVAAGQTVARIAALPVDAAGRARLEAQHDAAVAQRRSAEAALARARAAHDQAAREHERRRALVQEGALTEELLEQYALAARARAVELAAAEQAERAARAEESAARAALQAVAAAAGGAPLDVRAPAGGRVLRVPERSERVVAPGEPLLELGDADALEAVIDVLSSDAVRIRPGMPARLTGWGGPDLEAVVRLVEPSAFTRVSALGVEEQRVNVILDIGARVPGLGDGFRVEAAITVWSADDVLSVPAASLFRGPDGWQVFRIEDGRARLRSVTIGERGGGRTAILDGLAAGDVVVLYPSDRIEDGTRVRVRSATRR